MHIYVHAALYNAIISKWLVDVAKNMKHVSDLAL
jgi:hypothetical protein